MSSPSSATATDLTIICGEVEFLVERDRLFSHSALLKRTWGSTEEKVVHWNDDPQLIQAAMFFIHKVSRSSETSGSGTSPRHDPALALSKWPSDLRSQGYYGDDGGNDPIRDSPALFNARLWAFAEDSGLSKLKDEAARCFKKRAKSHHMHAEFFDAVKHVYGTISPSKGDQLRVIASTQCAKAYLNLLTQQPRFRATMEAVGRFGADVVLALAAKANSCIPKYLCRYYNLRFELKITPEQLPLKDIGCPRCGAKDARVLFC